VKKQQLLKAIRHLLHGK